MAAMLLRALVVVFFTSQHAAAFRTIRLGGSRAAGSPAGRPIITRLVHPDVPAQPFQLAALQTSAVSSRSLRSPGTEVSARQMDALLRGRLSAGVGSLPARFGPAVADAPEEADRPRGVLGLTDAYGTEYVGLVGIGTRRGKNGEVEPEAVLRVVYDTGSADFWVASDFCESGPCARRSRRRFNHSRSETFQDADEVVPIATTYGSGRLDGLLGFDDVRVGPMVVKHQPLGLISAMGGSAFELLPLDGVVGLSFRAITAHSTSPLFDSLVDQHLLPKSEFAFYLHPERSLGGAMLWGGIDERLHDGPLVWYPVPHETYWALDLISFTVGNHTFNASAGHDVAPSAPSAALRGQAHEDLHAQPRTAGSGSQMQRPLLLVDSGTTFFTATARVYAAISEEVRPTPCGALGSLPSFVYTVRDSEGRPRTISVPPEEFMVKGDAEGMCIPGLVRQELFDGNDDMSMILGELFMRYHFTVFRRKDGDGRAEIGIARASHSADALAFFAETHADRPEVL